MNITTTTDTHGATPALHPTTDSSFSKLPPRSSRLQQQHPATATMPRLTPTQRHARDRFRRLDGSLWRKRIGHELYRPSTTERDDEEERTSLIERFDDVVIDRHEPAADAFVFETTEEEFEISAIVAKRWINEYPFYLVQWEGYTELTWEPRQILPWRLVARFELDTIDSVWLYQSTRGRRRPITRVGRRRSRRLNGGPTVFRFLV